MRIFFSFYCSPFAEVFFFFSLSFPSRLTGYKQNKQTPKTGQTCHQITEKRLGEAEAD